MDPDEATRLRQAIARLARRLNVTSTSEDLTPSQASVLGLVAARGPLGLTELADLEHLNPTMVSRVVGKLTGDGLIKRYADPQDLRSALVVITEHGAQVHARIKRERTETLRAGLERLAPEAAATLLSALPALEALLGELDPERAPAGRNRNQSP